MAWQGEKTHVPVGVALVGLRLSVGALHSHLDARGAPEYMAIGHQPLTPQGDGESQFRRAVRVGNHQLVNPRGPVRRVRERNHGPRQQTKQQQDLLANFHSASPSPSPDPGEGCPGPGSV